MVGGVVVPLVLEQVGGRGEEMDSFLSIVAKLQAARALGVSYVDGHRHQGYAKVTNDERLHASSVSSRRRAHADGHSPPAQLRPSILYSVGTMLTPLRPTLSKPGRNPTPLSAHHRLNHDWL